MPKKKEAFKATSEWGNLMRRGEHAVKEASGEVYRIEPVDLETFVYSPDYLNQGMWGMSEAQKEFIEKASDFENGINFFVLFVGKGGGKNWSSGILFLYATYKLLCMYDAHKYLNHNRAKALTFINVAINAKQAQDNFFEPLKNIIRAAGNKAFKNFGFDPGNDIQASSITFPQNIHIISANSRAGGIEGYDVLMALADEVDDVEFHGVEKIVNTLRTSSQSRFRGKEKIMVISYRRYVGSSGKIMEYYSKARGLDHVYARRYASWEFHPILSKDDFQTYYNENPEKAACMYGSEDSGSFVDSWLKDQRRIKNSMNTKRGWIIDWPLPYDPQPIGSELWWNKESHDEWRAAPLSEHTYKDENGVLQVLDPYDLPIKEYGNPNFYYVLTGDPALGSEANGGDGYGICLGHRELVTDEDGRKYVRPVIDFAFRFTGRMFEEGQVQMVAVENLIKKLKERMGYNIRIFSFDGWNSISLTQWISKTYKNIIVYDRSIVDYKDYTALRDAIFGEAPPSNGKGTKESNGGIDFPWHPIVYEELRNLREDRTKNPPKIDHIEGQTKDISDALARMVRILKYEWPYRDVLGAGTSTTNNVEQRIRSKVATEDDKAAYQESLNSMTTGLGSWRTLKESGKTLRLSDVLPFNDL